VGRTGRLTAALLLTLVYMIVEAIGGWLSNSLALVADAGHMLTDVAALGLTLAAIWFASRPATHKKTFGFYRLEILAAFVNGLALALLSIWVIYEAVLRWRSPPSINGSTLTFIAIGGLVINIIAALLLRSRSQNDLNMHSAWLHVMSDLVGSAMAIAAGILISLRGWMWADPLCSILISLIIVAGAVRLVLESVNILLEGTPAHIDLSDVEKVISQVAGVEGVHDLHVWTISSGMEALSAHISHNESVGHSELLAEIRERIHTMFAIDHLTIQMEGLNNETEAIYICETGTRCFEPARRS
jgi:cobalt-zinc-cadmium efflux system protein